MMTIPSTDEMRRAPIKTLARTLAALDCELAEVKEAARQTQKRASELENAARKAREIMAEKSKPAEEPTVSDHALVRWMERQMGIDLDEIRAQILTPERADMIRFGAKAINAGNVTLKVDGMAIVTVL